MTKEKTEVCTFYPAGAFEEARNVSQLPNSKESVIEPRIVGVMEYQVGSLEGLDVAGVQDRVVAKDAAPRPDEHDSSHQNQV